MSLGSGGQPDYYGAANATAEASRQATNAQTLANRPNITTPWGTLNWQQTQNAGIENPQYTALQNYINSQPNDAAGNARRAAAEQQLAGMSQYTTAPTTSWAMNVELTPEQQQALEAQQAISRGRSDIAQSLLGQAQSDITKGIDYSGFTDVGTGDTARNQAINAAYEQAVSRLNPQWSQKESALQTQLANQGLDINSEAYQKAMENLGQSRNDAFTSAMNAAIGQGTSAGQALFNQNLQARQQQIGEANQQQYGALNAMNALLGGQQVSMPTFPGFAQAGSSQSPNYLSAAQLTNQYNQQNQGNLADLFSGAGSFGSSLFGFSDARLKRRIRRSRIEIIPGVRLARWEWLDGSSGFGVVAQDVARVAPHLVKRHSSGYLMVDYGGLL